MKFQEGTLFYFDLKIEQPQNAVGLIARRQMGSRVQKPTFLGFFWVLEPAVAPTLEIAAAYLSVRPKLVTHTTTMGFWLDHTWNELGQAPQWPQVRENFNHPPFFYYHRNLNKWTVYEHIEDDVEEQRGHWASDKDPAEGWASGLCGHTAVENLLRMAVKEGKEKVNWCAR